ncbi:MAG TPA: hypothetical protein VK145_01465, partial [Candidatus Nanoarchaeia archaeon]|nr:hypothetical protein [Candidatus Nanoarchaeia archaeon]
TAAGAIASGQTGATAMSYAICGARSPSGSTQASWMVAVPLKSAPQLNLFSGIPGAVRGWCVDSAGNSKLISSALPQAPTQCP